MKKILSATLAVAVILNSFQSSTPVGAEEIAALNYDLVLSVSDPEGLSAGEVT